MQMSKKSQKRDDYLESALERAALSDGHLFSEDSSWCYNNLAELENFDPMWKKKMLLHQSGLFQTSSSLDKNSHIRMWTVQGWKCWLENYTLSEHWVKQKSCGKTHFCSVIFQLRYFLRLYDMVLNECCVCHQKSFITGKDWLIQFTCSPNLKFAKKHTSTMHVQTAESILMLQWTLLQSHVLRKGIIFVSSRNLTFATKIMPRKAFLHKDHYIISIQKPWFVFYLRKCVILLRHLMT